MRRLLDFPNPVNELAARTVAAGVLALTVLTIVLATTVGTGWLWLTAVLAYGFVARVLSGPRPSPLGQFATRVVAPRLGPPRYVPGPPKRFAQGMGATMSLLTVVLHFGFHADRAALVVLGLVVVAATLESAFAYCIGCKVFAGLMRVGLVPESVCLECTDVSRRLPQPA
jgi:Domain of unknown function (DUF4395)